ncbi:ribonuclease P protein subunit p40-like [Physella acuta]|uniref:ribonuclease P protein subunit p40-like n=1 Tax=Physella acuta TaxID=109671 RepID=UPI0027DBB258|nr:ribonuclease P protein subunit p40-like [Physella acuta]
MALAPLSSPFVFESHTLSKASEKQKDVSKIRKHYFNHAITLILPGIDMVPNYISHCFLNQMSYSLHQLPLYRLIEMPFLQTFVKKGAMYVLSINTQLDTDNCVSITPTGQMLLSLTKDTYEELGLQAETQSHQQKKTNKFVVAINLLEESFRPGKKGYEKTMWCLKDRLDLIFDFHISWEPHDDNICSSSVGVYFVGKCKEVKRLDPHRTSRIETSVLCPRLDAQHPTGSDSGCHYRDVFEWMGALACNVPLPTEVDNYVSSLLAPEPNANCPRCCVFQASGFITPKTILNVWNIIRSHSDQFENYPVCLMVHGYSDSPVNKNQFYSSRDNFYSLALFDEDQCWSFAPCNS